MVVPESVGRSSIPRPGRLLLHHKFVGLSHLRQAREMVLQKGGARQPI